MKEKLNRFFLTPWSGIVVVIIAVLVDLAAYRHAVGYNNHAIQLPYLFWLNDPALYPGDPFIDSMSGYFSYFWLVMAWFVRHWDINIVFLVGHLLTLGLKYTVVWLMGRHLYRENALAAPLFVWWHLFSISSIGDEGMHWFYFAHTPVATSFGYLALYLALRGWWIAAFAVAGFIYNIHAMQSAYLLVILGLPYALHWRFRGWKGVLPGIAFFIAMLPGFIWMLRLGAQKSPEDLSLLLRAFFPIHFFPSAQNGRAIVDFVCMTTAFVVSLALLPRSANKALLTWMAVAVLIFWTVGGVMVETIGPGALIKMHIYRAAPYYLTAILALFSGVLATRLIPWVPPHWRAQVVWALFLIPPFISARFFIDRNSWVANTLFVVTLVGIVAATVAKLPMLYRQWSAWIAVAAFVWFSGLQQRNAAAGMTWYLRCFVHWYDVQDWARENTPPGTLFLTPPDHIGWRVRSLRPTVGEWLDGAAIMWDTKYADYWRDWYLQAGGDFDDEHDDPIHVRLGRSWMGKSRAEIEAIARRHGAKYIVMRPPHGWESAEGVPPKWDGPKLYENSIFYVVPVPDE